VTADPDRQAGPAGEQGGVARDVVGVAVGQQDGLRNEPALLDVGHDRAGLEPGIDDHAVGRTGAKEHVAVLVERL